MEKPQDVTENGEYVEPNTFEIDREAILFYSYLEQIKYIKQLETDLYDANKALSEVIC